MQLYCGRIGSLWKSNAPGSESGEWKAQCIILTAHARQEETDLALCIS
jgi:hypothetical protein